MSESTEKRGEMLDGETFGAFVKRRFKDGLIRRGAHEPNGLACVLEARNVAVTGAWNDRPGNFPDLRALNDGPWASDQERTEHMIPLMEALWDWEAWGTARQTAWVKRVTKRTISEILPPVLRSVGLDKEADACRDGGDEKSAKAAYAAAYAARAAARAADAAAAAAACAAIAAACAAIANNNAKSHPLILMCRIMIESVGAK